MGSAAITMVLGIFLTSLAQDDELFESFDRFQQLPAGEFWPEFDPALRPLAVAYGGITLLVNRDEPVKGFEYDEDFGLLKMFGRPQGLRANTAIMLEGVLTASAILDRRFIRSSDQILSLFVHEAFHAFQREHFPGWSTNEALLFTYPETDFDFLMKRALENHALKRALDSEREDRWNWARHFVELRDGRVAMSAEGTNYERGVESYEGLAHYVELYCVGQKPNLSPVYTSDLMRHRGYEVGACIAFLLDALSDDWKHELNSVDPKPPLDQILKNQLLDDGIEQAASLSEEQTESVVRLVKNEIARTQNIRREIVREFEQKEGWTLLVEAESEPFQCEAFDPLNVTQLGEEAPLELIHRRWLKLSHPLGSFECFERVAKTYGMGPHPLFSGITKAEIRGLEEPLIQEGAETGEPSPITIQFGDFQLRFARGTLKKESKTIRVKI